ncbi:MAG TPA: winged helix-turn-helix domain-containing protein [Trebonia sp.]|nr:winged helix-turn-helix domain-containing protein [Trebonia sp.]
MEIGTRLLPRHEADSRDGEAPAPEPSQQWPGTAGTLLAVVPIPGTGTSLAIVGYPVSNATLPRRAYGDEDDDARDGAGGPRDQSRLPAGLFLDHEQRRVWADGHEISLTYQEFELLAFLSAHPATVFSRADLVEQVWQRDFATDSRTVDVHVSRLRRKLGPQYGRYLVTEYRVGYQFRPAAR